MHRLCQQENQVIATGGGVIFDPENVKDMKQSGKAVWLTASPETILARMAGDEKTGGSGLL